MPRTFRNAKEKRRYNKKRLSKRKEQRDRDYPGWREKCPVSCRCLCHDPDIANMYDHPGRPCPGKAPV